MALTFPAAPADGDIHTVGSLTWTYSAASDSWLGSIGGSSLWTMQTSGISRADRIAVGAATDPKVTVDVIGTIGQNAQTTTGTIDASTGQVFDMTVSGATTISITGAIPDSVTVVLRITNGGSAVVSFSGISFDGGIAPSLTASGTDILTFFTSDGGTSWVGSVFALDAQ